MQLITAGSSFGETTLPKFTNLVIINGVENIDFIKMKVETVNELGFKDSFKEK